MKRLYLLLACLLLPSIATAQNTDYTEELIYRTTLGSAQDVALLMQHVNHPNLTDSLGYPLLYIAASRNDDQALAVVQTLVDAGSDVNFDNGKGFYPIFAALQSDHVPMVRYLLAQGADYKSRDSAGLTLTLAAAQTGNAMLQQLVQAHVQKGRAAAADLTSQSGLNKLTHQLAYNACAVQYFSYYYKSGQDDIAPATQQQTLRPHQQNIATLMGKIHAYFKIPQPELSEFYHRARRGIFQELEQMVSNRWRRSKGVGNTADMETRCTKHAAAFARGVFSKAQYERIK